MAQLNKKYVLSVVTFLKTADQLADVLQDKVADAEVQADKEEVFDHAVKFRDDVLSTVSMALEELYILAQDTCQIPQDSWDVYDQLYRLVCSHEGDNMDDLMQEIKQILS